MGAAGSPTALWRRRIWTSYENGRGLTEIATTCKLALFAMEHNFFRLSQYLSQHCVHHPRSWPPSCNHSSVDLPRFTSPPPTPGSCRLEHSSHVIEDDDWFIPCKQDLSDSIQVAQYECLDFPVQKLEACSDCLVDTYAAPIVEIMNSVFLMEGCSPFGLRKESSTVAGLRVECFDIFLKNPKHTERPIHSVGSVVEPWPCGVFGILVPPGTLGEVTDLVRLHEESSIVSKVFDVLRAQLAKRGTYVPFGILSDQNATILLNTLTLEYVANRNVRYCTGGFVSNTYSVRYILAALSYKILHEHSLSRYPANVPLLRRYLGASPLQVPDIPADPRWFSDFDMYTMQRNWGYWRACYVWREKVAYEGQQESLEAGSILRLESRGFEKRRIMFAPSSHRKLPLPQATFDSVNANRRPRDTIIDKLLTDNNTLSFTVTKVIRVGMQEWSQVVFGRLEGHDKDLCFKILDERQFPFPDYHENQFWGASGEPEYYRLPSLVFSEDLLNREAAVYRRLSELQGTLLPHCYGFHLITLPSGWQAYGVLLELIDAPTVYQLLESQPLPLEEYKDLFLSIKHGLSALGHATISQADCNTNNIMCPLDSSGNRTAVFIDFAFAYLHLGDEAGIRSFNDTMAVMCNIIAFYPGQYERLEAIWGPKDDFCF